MDLWGTNAQSPRTPFHQPNYASYIVLRKVGRNNAVSYCPATEDLNIIPLFKRTRKFVYGCKHFPEVEVDAKATWSCEFCCGAKLIEHATRSNEVVLSLDIDELLCNYYTSYENMDSVATPVDCTQATKSTWNEPASLEERRDPEPMLALPSTKRSLAVPLDFVEYEHANADFVGCEQTLFVRRACDARETKTCETSSSFSSPEREVESSCRDRGSYAGIGTSSCCEWSSDCTEHSYALSDGESMSWESSTDAGPASPNKL